MFTDTTALAYSISDAAKRIGISRSGLYVLIARGEIPTAKIGRGRSCSTMIFETISPSIGSSPTSGPQSNER
jgi:excisionase family DNA binding protein